MGVQKSHNLPSAKLENKNTSDILAQLQRPENWGAVGVNYDLNLNARETGAPKAYSKRRWMLWLKGRERTGLSHAFLFYLGPL